MDMNQARHMEWLNMCCSAQRTTIRSKGFRTKRIAGIDNVLTSQCKASGVCIWGTSRPATVRERTNLMTDSIHVHFSPGADGTEYVVVLDECHVGGLLSGATVLFANGRQGGPSQEKG